MDRSSEKDYQLIEENVRDVEYHSRKNQQKRYMFIALLIIAIIAGFIALIFTLKIEKSAESSDNNNNEEPKCPLNPQYPMKGGAGCADPCESSLGSASLNFEGKWPSHFLDKMDDASFELEDYISNFGLNQSILGINARDTDLSIHMTMDYFCCLSHIQLQKVNKIVTNYTWPIMEITFEKVICTQDGWHNNRSYPNNTYVEIVAYLNNRSQEIVLGAVAELEQIISDADIPIKVPRDKNIGFHSTIGFVNGTEIVVPYIVEELNKMIDWNDESIIINSPQICTVNKLPINGVNYSCLTG